MGNGVFLTLLIGPVVPVPVPRTVLDALASVTVRVTAEPRQQSGFDLTFSLSQRSPLHTLFLLSGSAPIPLLRVILIVTVKGTPEVLMDGVVTRQDVSSGEGGRAELKITGVDISEAMNLVDFSGFPYPALPIEGRVAVILAKYIPLGIVPVIIPALLMDISLPIDEIPQQVGKDLPYIQQLAEEIGYVFYTSPGRVPGTSVAYFGPEVKIGVPQKALNVDMDAHTNVENLSFSIDVDKAKVPIAYVYNKLTKLSIPVPIPTINPLSPPLGLIPPKPLNFEPLPNVSHRSLQSVLMRGIAEAARASEAVHATGSLNVLRYGAPLKARGLVGVRGAGMAFDGLYYVKSVTHTLKRGEYKQSFELTRNGLISTVPRVPA
jgi:hypothetical protein